MNPERVLGYLIRAGLRSGRNTAGGFNMGGKAGLGMGALGLAMAAFEHFSARNKPAQSSSEQGSQPPPLPEGSAPPPPPAAPSEEESQLLIRAMIAAANADGVIDSKEQNRIMQAARQSGLEAEDLEYLESEINRPRTMFEIVAGATSTNLAQQVYAASLLAIDRDTEHERTYLRQLASSLHLDDAAIFEIEKRLGTGSVDS